MYPLKFKPILKSTIWGGEKIIPFKHLDCQQAQVGESWEISDVPGDESVVADGAGAYILDYGAVIHCFNVHGVNF